MSRWIFLRHGESTSNAARRLAGWDDVQLTDTGRQQASAAGRILATEDLERVLTSDLSRARTTAALALEAWTEARPGARRPPVHELVDLRERHLGLLQGVSLDTLRQDGRMEVLRSWRGRLPGCESLSDLAARTLRCLADLPEHPGTTLVVAHGGVIRVLLGLLEDQSIEVIGDRRIPNAQPDAREVAPGTWARLAEAHPRLQPRKRPPAQPLPSPPLLILGSASPRRRDLLATAGIAVAAIDPADIDESRLPGEPPARYAARLAREKADTVATRAPEDSWVLAADTVVHLELDGEQRVLGKPADEDEAGEMLAMLSGRWHRVTTGWALSPGQGEPALAVTGVVTARVRFRALSQAERRAYTKTGEPYDKAGGYGIQGKGAAIVAQVEGDYSAVVGLPMEAVLEALSERGILPTEPALD